MSVRILLFLLYFLPALLYGQQEGMASITDRYKLEITNYSDREQVKPNTIAAIYEDNSGQVWIIGSESPYTVYSQSYNHKLWKFDGHQFIAIALPDEIKAGSVKNFSIFELDTDHFIVNNRNTGKSYIFNKSLKTYTIINNAENKSVYVHDLKKYRSQAYISSCDNGKIKIHTLNGSLADLVFILDDLDCNQVCSFFFRKDEIVINNHDIYRINLKGKVIKKYNDQELNSQHPEKLSSTSLHKSLLNSTDYGILIYDENRDNFRSFLNSNSKENKEKVICDAGGNYISHIYSPTENRLHLHDKDGNVINLDYILKGTPLLKHFEGKHLGEYFWYSDGADLFQVRFVLKSHFFDCNERSARAIFRTPNGEITAGFIQDFGWQALDKSNDECKVSAYMKAQNISTFFDPKAFFVIGEYLYSNNRDEIIKINLTNNKVTTFKLPNQIVLFMNNINDDFLVIGSYNGDILGFDIKNEKFVSYMSLRNFASSPIVGQDVDQIEKEVALFSTDHGLFELNTQTKKVKKLNDVPTLSLTKIKNGQIYFGGLDNKLYQYDAKSNTYHSILELSSPIATITEDGDERLWLATFGGLAVYDIHNKSTFYFGKNDLIHLESNRYSSFYDEKDNTMYIGSIKGVTAFNLAYYNPDLKRYRLHFSNIETGNNAKSIETKDYFRDTLVNVNLSYKDSYLKLFFYINDPNRNDVTYFYKFKNQQEWLSLGNKNEIMFPSFSAGHHAIEIRAKDSKNQWSENTLNVHVYVADIFYNQWWFYLIVFLLLFGLIYYWYKRNKTERSRLESEVALRTKELVAERQTILKQSDELMVLDGMKNRFFANISHELRTPLTLLISPLQQLTSGTVDQNKQAYYLQLMDDNSRLLQDRIDELLELSRLEAHEVRLAKQNLKLYDLIDFSTRIFKPVAEVKEINYVVEQINTNINVVADEKRLSKVIQNIANNAIKFTHKGGNVFCKFEYETGHFKMVVSDNGIGISEGEISRIFQRFFQVKAENTMANPGTGIGLSMVKEYIDLMDGTIHVESKLNEGTTFIVDLPIQQTSDVETDNILYPIEKPTFSFVPLPTKDKPTILLAEDNYDLRKYISSLLSNHFIIVEAENGLIALNKLMEQKQHFDIVISDIMMPEMDGVTLLSRVRSDERWRIIPFIFLTAKHNEEDTIQAFKMGVDDYIKKPFSEEELLYRLHAVYNNYKARVESVHKNNHHQSEASAVDSALVAEIKDQILLNLNNPEFSIEYIASKMNISTRNFYRLVKSEVGTTPNEYIREIKLHLARNLFEANQSTTVDEVVSAIGFTDKRYFKKAYFERFGSRL
jgi:signal transduction histidine kinase/DNA-binding response OmpR family regulator